MSLFLHQILKACKKFLHRNATSLRESQQFSAKNNFVGKLVPEYETIPQVHTGKNGQPISVNFHSHFKKTTRQKFFVKDQKILN